MDTTPWVPVQRDRYTLVGPHGHYALGSRSSSQRSPVRLQRDRYMQALMDTTPWVLGRLASAATPWVPGRLGSAAQCASRVFQRGMRARCVF